jgi:hypothetical protein
MIEQQRGADPGRAGETRRRRAGVAAFLGGFVAVLAFFAFFPGLPHVIDGGALLVAVAIGVIAQWLCRSWMARTARKKAERT